MAKSTQFAQAAHEIQWESVKDVHFRDVVWFREYNVRDDYGSKSERANTRYQLVRFGGWDQQYAIQAMVATKEEIARAVSDLQDRFRALLAEKEQSDDKIHEIRFNVFCQLFCKNSKQNIDAILPPKYVGVTCNRRGAEYFEAQVELASKGFSAVEKGAKAAEGLESSDGFVLNDRVAVLIPLNTEDRRLDDDLRTQVQVLENETKTAGAKTMTARERLKVVRKAVLYGGMNQSKLERNFGFKGTLRVLLYYAVRCDAYFEEQGWNLRFLERLMAPQYLDEKGEKPNPDWLDFGRFGQHAYQGPTKPDHAAKRFGQWGLRCEAQSRFDAENQKREKAEKLKRPTKKEAKEWIHFWQNDKRARESGRQKMMSGPELEAISKDNPILMVRDVAKAIHKGGEEGKAQIQLLARREELLNFVYHVTEKGATKANDAGLSRKFRLLPDDFKVWVEDQLVELVNYQYAEADKAGTLLEIEEEPEEETVEPSEDEMEEVEA